MTNIEYIRAIRQLHPFMAVSRTPKEMRDYLSEVTGRDVNRAMLMRIEAGYNELHAGECTLVYAMRKHIWGLIKWNFKE